MSHSKIVTKMTHSFFLLFARVFNTLLIVFNLFVKNARRSDAHSQLCWNRLFNIFDGQFFEVLKDFELLFIFVLKLLCIFLDDMGMTIQGIV